MTSSISNAPSRSNNNKIVLILLAVSFFLSIFSLSTCNFVNEYSEAEVIGTTTDSSIPTKKISVNIDAMIDLLFPGEAEGVGTVRSDFFEGRKKLSDTSDINCSFPCISNTAEEYKYDSGESRKVFHYYGLLASQPRGQICQFGLSPTSSFATVCVAIAIILTCRNTYLIYMEKRNNRMENLRNNLRFATIIAIVLFLTSIIVVVKTRCKNKCSLGVGMIILLCVVVIQAVVWYTLHFPLRGEVLVTSDESNEEQCRTSSKNKNYIVSKISSHSSEHNTGDLEENLHMINSEHSMTKPETRSKHSLHEKSVERGITSVTIDGVTDVSDFIIFGLILVMNGMYRGVMHPTVWPLVKSLGGTEITQGYTVAAFSVGRAMFNPIFGSCCTKLGYRKTYILSTTTCLFGTFTYCQVTNPNFGGLGVLIISQFLMGAGSGTNGASYAFVADVTPTASRTKYLGWVSALRYFGNFIGSLLSKFFDNETNHWKVGIVNMNMYSAPGYFMLVVNASMIIVLIIFFTDRIKPDGNREKKKTLNNLQRPESQGTIASNGRFTTYQFAVITCGVLYICIKGSMAIYETLGIKLATEYFGMKCRSAGFVIAVGGFIGVITLLYTGTLDKCRQDIQMVLLATIATLISSGSLALLHKQQVYSKWIYILALLLVYSFGFPVGNNSTLSLFSKIVGRRPQGKLMGWFVSAGSMTRIIVPITTGYIAEYGGDVAPFRILSSILAIYTVLIFLSRNRIQEYFASEI